MSDFKEQLNTNAIIKLYSCSIQTPKTVRLKTHKNKLLPYDQEGIEGIMGKCFAVSGFKKKKSIIFPMRM